PSLHSEGHEITIQPRTLSTDNPVIVTLESERLSLFATALFFTVLVDQVCYTHFKVIYPEFQNLTRYPKFRGDCPVMCCHHIHPTFIFKAIGAAPGPRYDRAQQAKLLDEATQVMHAQVLDFFSTHLRSIDGEHVWRECVKEMAADDRLI